MHTMLLWKQLQPGSVKWKPKSVQLLEHGNSVGHAYHSTFHENKLMS